MKKELNIYTYQDLLEHFPHRHIDKTKINRIEDIHSDSEFIQVVGRLISLETIGENRGRRLVGQLKDSSGILELAWFQGINWVEKNLTIGSIYLVYGRTGVFNNRPQIVHPEMECMRIRAQRAIVVDWTAVSFLPSLRSHSGLRD